MSRNLDTSLAAALSNDLIYPVVLVALTLNSGVMYIWSGVGDLVYNDNTYLGVGALGTISAIAEGSSIQADGMTVSLTGIGFSPFSIDNTPPTGVTPPVTPSAGQYVAWSKPTVCYPTQSGTGAAFGDATGGVVSVTGDVGGVTILDRGTASLSWSGFTIPTLPSDAVVQAIYPVMSVITEVSECTLLNGTDISLPAPNFSGQYAGASFGTDLASAIGSYNPSIGLGYSLDGDIFYDTLSVSYPGLAIYYTTADNASTLVNEALSDVQIGAPAKVWFGLMTNGALIGNPYLIFSGQVDQPTIDISTQTATISLDLETRLADLNRPTARRYTAADQHLMYPDDIGFNWVEILNDIALRWGN